MCLFSLLLNKDSVGGDDGTVGHIDTVRCLRHTTSLTTFFVMSFVNIPRF
jgi:hypothetical protein